MSTDVQKAAEVEKNVLLEPEWIDASNISDETTVIIFIQNNI